MIFSQSVKLRSQSVKLRWEFRIWYVTNREALELKSPIKHYVQSWGSEWMVRKLMSSYNNMNLGITEL